MELPVLKIDGTPSGKNVTLEEGVFGITPNDHAIYLDVVQYLANQRHGNAKTKDRSENSHNSDVRKAAVALVTVALSPISSSAVAAYSALSHVSITPS